MVDQQGYPAHFREWSADGQGPHDHNTGATECAQQFCSAYTLWLFDVALENGPFIVDFWLNIVISHSYVK